MKHNTTLSILKKATLTAFLIGAIIIDARAQTSYGTGAGTGGNVSDSYFGYYAGAVNTGSNNTFLGGYCASNNTTGINNTVSGYGALYYNTTGSYNTASGSLAMLFNTTGANNTATGYNTLYYNTTGVNNTGTGINTLRSNTVGGYNTASGAYTMYSNTTGSNNTASGYYAMFSNTTGFNNTVSGTQALRTNGTGYYNTALGAYSLYDNTTVYNLGVGAFSGYNNTTGIYNTYVGNLSGYLNSTGSYNVFLGMFAGYYETGSNKLYIENSTTSSPLIYGDFSSNQVAINGIPVSSYTFTVNGTTYSSGGYYTSDERLKQNKEQINGARALLSQLNGYTYTFKENVRLPNYQEKPAITNEGGNESVQPEVELVRDDSEGYWQLPEGKQFGVIAQEVQKVIPELISEDDYGTLAVNYNGFIPLLIEAVNEIGAEKATLQEEIEALKGQNESLLEELNAIKAVLGMDTQENQGSGEASGTEGAALLQNYPNPTSGSTTIQFRLPEATQSAQIIITNMQGQTIQVFSSLTGKSQVILEAGTLSSGTYVYSLVVNGNKVDSKSLVVE